MSADRTKPGASFWLTIVAVACLAWPASLGPSCWVTSRTGVGSSVVDVVYSPILLAAEAFPNCVSVVVERYSSVGAARGWEWVQWWHTATGESQGWHWRRDLVRFRPTRTLSAVR